jgi:hypothetical protein
MDPTLGDPTQGICYKISNHSKWLISQRQAICGYFWMLLQGRRWKGNKVLSSRRHLEVFLLEKNTILYHFIVASNVPGRVLSEIFHCLSSLSPPLHHYPQLVVMLFRPVQGCHWWGGINIVIFNFLNIKSLDINESLGSQALHHRISSEICILLTVSSI